MWQAIESQLFFDPHHPLVFNSAFFFVFFSLFFFFYTAVYRKTTLRLWLVCAFSLFFFYKACGEYVIFILIAAVIDFRLSHWIAKTENQGLRKLGLIVSIVLNLGLLFYFKYTDFFIEIWNQWQTDNVSLLHLALPVGISFYTFENLSYTIDVYRKHFKPVDRFVDYLFFLSFFPKLMMGPIVRAADFLPQIRQQINITKEDIGHGMFFILSGCFKKMVISDFLYTNLVEVVFDDPSRYNGVYSLFAVYAYAMVIYCDFSGYSDMAIGIARWMGLKINVNFTAPYQSASITEFWRRWHISLSSWLKDYLYIPLGGNRKGLTRTYLHLLITMFLGGLWHGANWTFIIWGILHGSLLAIDKWRIDQFKPAKEMSRFKQTWAIVLTFHLVVFCWIFFGPDSLDKSLIIIDQIANNFDLSTMLSFVQHYQNVLMMLALAIVLHQLPMQWNERVITLFSKQKMLTHVVIMVSILMIVAYFKSDTPVAPIYLQF
jgi:D-alanyl-lipoteichoic acid acyltransferase DltB (MBOAT superfamily)